MAPKPDARGGRRNRPDARNAGGNRGRGGIRKRAGGKSTVDQDGDQSMGDITGAGARGRGAPRGPRGGRTGRGNRGDNIARALQSGQGRVIDSRMRGRNDEELSARVRVLGLKDSKAAASNRDGGLKLLLEFIQKKAGSRPPKTPVRVKQVCLLQRSRWSR